MKVICYGDSNTWGYDPRGFFGGRYEVIWTELLADKTGWNVINQGENGRQIPQKSVSFPLDTELLILMLGTNDLLQSQSPEKASESMERFLTWLNLDFRKVLLIAPPSMVLGEWVRTQELINNSISLANYYKDLAANLGIRFADAGKWNIPMAFDGVHFTAEGHRAFAEGLWKELAKQ